MLDVKVTDVPEQIDEVPEIETVGVTEEETFPLPVGLLDEGVIDDEPPLPPILSPLDATEASIVALLHGIAKFKSTTKNSDIVVAVPPEAVGVAEKELNVILFVGFAIVAMSVALAKLVLVPE